MAVVFVVFCLVLYKYFEVRIHTVTEAPVGTINHSILTHIFDVRITGIKQHSGLIWFLFYTVSVKIGQLTLKISVICGIIMNVVITNIIATHEFQIKLGTLRVVWLQTHMNFKPSKY